MLKVQEGIKCLRKFDAIAAHVPEIVAYSSLDETVPYSEQFNGVLLFADISGFTALTEKFSCKKGHGADELTRTLNSYVGDIVNHILVHGGDILNFAGDAILALWAVERSQLSEVITVAVGCSLNIQDHCGIRMTEVGCQLRVKIAISAGKLSKVIVGDTTSQYYVVIGRAVDEVRLAEGLADASTIILSPNAWELCNRQDLAIDRIENERAVKVRYIKQVPNISMGNYLQDLGKNVKHTNLQKRLRTASSLVSYEERENVVRKYIMKTVLQKIDDDQPLEYLSEIRHATIVFVNLQFEDAKSDMEQCIPIHKAAIGIGQQMLCHHGKINKVFMFDKGCTFLCLFGLPGDKRVDESAHALQAAYSIQETCLQEINSLKTVSVGVTTGPVFCGVMGHPLRHEYTVIGRKVNLAARLMMYYPGLVSCDIETHDFSGLPSFYFTELPKKALKGVHRPGPIFQFIGNACRPFVSKAPMSFQRKEDFPLLGRQKELEVYFKALKDFLKARSSIAKTYNRVIIFEGATGYGKSHLLAEIVHRASKEKVRVMPFELTKVDIKQSNYTLQTLLALLLEIQDCSLYAERERVILSKIHDPELRENVCFLNDILQVKFPVLPRVSHMDSQTKDKETRKYFLQLFCKLAEEEPSVYVIDQAHFVDQASWNFLLEVCQQASLLMFMALLPQARHSGPDLEHIICLPHTIYYKLPVLDPTIIAQLAHQVLNVIYIPDGVKQFLVQRSHGVPYYCKELLKGLYLGGLIMIEAIKEEELEYKKNLYPEASGEGYHSRPSQMWQEKEVQDDNILLGQQRSSAVKARKTLALDGSPAEQSFVCLVGKSANFSEVPVPLTLKGLALAHFDQLQPFDQTVIKCAAIIGYTFTTQMLQAIVPDVTQQNLNLSLVSLFRSGTFECASKNNDLPLPLSKETEDHMLSCYCADVVKLASVAGVWKCQMMCFCTSLLKETIYELCLKEQKKEMHLKCASYLQQLAYCCHACTRDEFICGHKAAVGSIITDSNDDLIQESFNVHSNQVFPMEENGNDDKSFLARVDRVVAERCASIDCRASCRCTELVEHVLTPMVNHWMGVGDVPMTFYYLLETAAACIYLCNYIRALSNLNKAKAILKNLKAGKPAFETAELKRKVKICKFEKSCVFRLTGEIQFNTGQILEAEDSFVKALRLLNRGFPRNPVALSIMYICEKMKYLHYRFRDIEIPQDRELALLQERICCLSYLWQISCMRRLPRRASLAITMEINSAACSAEKFKVLFSAIDYFQYSQMVGDEVECSRYKRLLYRRFAKQPYCSKELELIFYFTHTVALVTLCAGNLEQSVQYTAQAQQVIKVLNRHDLEMWATAVLYMPLLLTKRYKECVQLIQSLEQIGTMLHISLAKGWFYAACFDFLLYAGFAFRPIEECLTFVEECQSDPNVVVDRSLMINLYSATALWYARLAVWDKVTLFYRKAYDVYVKVPPSIYSIRGVVMFLECSVLLLKKALNEPNKHTKPIYNKTKKCFADFSQHFATNHIFKPRVLHLKAFLYLLVGHAKVADDILKQALLLSEKQGNLLDQSWIRQSQDAWSGTCSQRPVDWLAATLCMPSWEEAVKCHPKDLLYYFVLKELASESAPQLTPSAASERGQAHAHASCSNSQEFQESLNKSQ